MAAVRELLSEKPVGVLTTSPDVTVLTAAILMNERGIGSVLVLDGESLIGIFTERDLMRRVVAVVKDPATTMLRDVMTTALVTCTPDATIDDCGALMSERRIRHLPVVAGGKVMGLITTGDLLAHELREKDSVIQQLESFVFYVRQ
jgi:CBS domain-containing protein